LANQKEKNSVTATADDLLKLILMLVQFERGGKQKKMIVLKQSKTQSDKNKLNSNEIH